MRSRLHVVSLDGGAVREHAVPMAALAKLLEDWNAALAAAIAPMLGLDDGESARAAVRYVVPMAVAARPGSVEQPWAYGVRHLSSPRDVPLFLAAADLDQLAAKFEDGVAGLENGRVAGWMSAKVAKPLQALSRDMNRRGIHIKLVGTQVVLGECAQKTLDTFVAQEESGSESELQVFGNVVSVNGDDRYFYAASPAHGKARVSFERRFRSALCRALADEADVELRVRATRTSDDVLEGARLLDIRLIERPSSYTERLARLWGVSRHVFAGVAHDERGVPEVDLDVEDHDQ